MPFPRTVPPFVIRIGLQALIKEYSLTEAEAHIVIADLRYPTSGSLGIMLRHGGQWKLDCIVQTASTEPMVQVTWPEEDACWLRPWSKTFHVRERILDDLQSRVEKLRD